MKIVISPYSQKMRNGKPHPKNYPFFEDLVRCLLLEKHELIQIGIHGEKQIVPDCRFNLSFRKLKELLYECDTFICVDNFFHHFAHHYGKSGIVIFAQSDPDIFGYPENINLLKDRKYLRKTQFWMWEQCEYNEDSFVDPEYILEAIRKIQSRHS